MIDEKAGQMFVKVASFEPTETIVAHTMVEGAKCMSKVSVVESNKILENAIELYSANGNIRTVTSQNYNCTGC